MEVRGHRLYVNSVDFPPHFNNQQLNSADHDMQCLLPVAGVPDSISNMGVQTLEHACCTQKWSEVARVIIAGRLALDVRRASKSTGWGSR